jgi:TrmH family RNA methyltransferase
VIIVGSESRGISPEVAEFVTKQITIPKFGQAESLNVAIATGIIFDNVMRLKK